MLCSILMHQSREKNNTSKAHFASDEYYYVLFTLIRDIFWFFLCARRLNFSCMAHSCRKNFADDGKNKKRKQVSVFVRDCNSLI